MHNITELYFTSSSGPGVLTPVDNIICYTMCCCWVINFTCHSVVTSARSWQFCVGLWQQDCVGCNLIPDPRTPFPGNTNSITISEDTQIADGNCVIVCALYIVIQTNMFCILTDSMSINNQVIKVYCNRCIGHQKKYKNLTVCTIYVCV